MKLQELFNQTLGQWEQKTLPAEFLVSGIFDDARKIIKDSVFVAIRGVSRDGHQFIPQAIQLGAKILVVEDIHVVPRDFDGEVVQVENTRHFLAKLAAVWVGSPSKKMLCFGVTGTNGKTSTTYLIEHLLSKNAKNPGVIGTVDHHLKQKIWPTTMTTPGPLELQSRLSEFLQAGADALAMEVSSHALHQYRVEDIHFDCALFTNLSRDHLDYHLSMEEYFLSKQKLFTKLLVESSKKQKVAVINVDDQWGERLLSNMRDLSLQNKNIKFYSYGLNKNSDAHIEITNRQFSKTEFSLSFAKKTYSCQLPLGGDHNVQNAVAAMLACHLILDIKIEKLVQDLQDFRGIPGRLQNVMANTNLTVFVDYAHTPDALEKVLKTLFEIKKGSNFNGQIWTIFGCGGDRDQGKRPLMLQVAKENSDWVMVTSDNPRNEDPKKIMSDIFMNLDKSLHANILSELDRKVAIQTVIDKAQKGDVILIAGKGHEKYQEINGTKFPFDDYEIAQQYLLHRGSK